MNDVNDKGRMELIRHRTGEMTARYTHLSRGYKKHAVETLPSFIKAVLEADSQQIFTIEGL